MSKKRQDLAKSMVSRVPRSPLQAEIFYVQRGKSPAGLEFAEHSHPFWQIELINAGRLVCRTPTKEHHLGPGDGLLIPARMPHQFSYQDHSQHTSIKFQLDGTSPIPRAIPLSGLPGWSGFQLVLDSLLKSSRPEQRRQHAVTHVVEAIVALALTPHTDSDRIPSLVEQIRSLVEHSEQQRWTVARVARALGRSSGHISALFRAQAAMPLKTFLDQARHESAAHLLATTDLPIGDIATQLDFPDVFAFSRFFKRTAGMSPRAWRAQVRTH